MTAWKIFWKALTLISDNLWVALRISAPVMILYAIFVFSAASLFLNINSNGQDLRGIALTTILTALGFIFAYLWVAVAWHRFVLLAERPTGLLPRLNGQAVLGYLGRIILIALIMVVPALFLTFLMAATFGFPSGGSFQGMIITQIVTQSLISVILAVFVYRISLILPARAIDNPINVSEALAKTEGSFFTILGLAILNIIFYQLLKFPSLLPLLALDSLDPGAMIQVMNNQGIIAQIYGLIVHWIILLLGVSILSVLHGHYIEGRALD